MKMNTDRKEGPEGERQGEKGRGRRKGKEACIHSSFCEDDHASVLRHHIFFHKPNNIAEINTSKRWLTFLNYWKELTQISRISFALFISGNVKLDILVIE